jgi:hypothetical protein
MQCAGCEGELGSRYFTWGSRSLPFCNECRKERFCLSCELPAFYVKEKDTHTECARCSAILPECANCGLIHTLEWWQVNNYTLCVKCGKRAKNFGRCLGCGDPASRDRHGWCRQCDSLPVHTGELDRIDALTEDVTSFMEESFNISVRGYCKLTLVSRKQFWKKGWNSTGLFSQRGDKRNIYIESGLPEPIFLGTLGHEAVHAWQQENCPRQTDRLSEGLATWIEFKVLEVCDVLHPAEWFEGSLPPFYLEAFRIAQKMEARLGASGFLREVRGWSRFPG